MARCSRRGRRPVAVQVMAHGVELRRRVDADQAVAVGVLGYRHGECLRRRPVRAASRSSTCSTTCTAAVRPNRAIKAFSP